jgi:hypothetical protein
MHSPVVESLHFYLFVAVNLLLTIPIQPQATPSYAPTSTFSSMSQEQLRLKYEELLRKEEELEAQESYLDAKEAELPPERKPNWPIFLPLVYHDINKDILSRTNRLFCWFAYITWYITMVGLVINFIGTVAILLTFYDVGLAAQDMGLACAYMVFYPPLQQVIWYRPLYNGARKDRASLYLCFLITHALHCLLVALILLGIPGTGSSGILNALAMYNGAYEKRPNNCDAISTTTTSGMSEDEKKKQEEDAAAARQACKQQFYTQIPFVTYIIAAALCTVTIVSWTINLVLACYLWFKIYIYFYTQRMTWRARQEIGALVLSQTGTIVSEAAKNPEVRSAAIQAAGEGLRATTYGPQ